jgi:L-ascorbate metabolism protein UlaG (beta-lactamase superfamily)
VDVVTVSHAHYDHLDLPTLQAIGNDAVYIVPRDNGDILRGAGLEKVVELGWWESHRIGDLTITGTEPKIAVGKFVPAKRNMAVQVDDAVITSFSSVSQ